MTGDTDTRKKANAVFFSVIMVLSMAAVGFAAAPAAAAESATIDDISLSDTAAEADNVDYTVEFSVDEQTDDVRYVSVNLTDQDNVNLSNVQDDGVTVNVNDTNVEAESDPLFSTDDDVVIVELDGAQSFDTVDDLDVQIDDITNGDAGTYDLTLGLHEEDADEPVDAKTTATDQYTIEATGSFSGTITNAIDGEPVNDTEFEFTDVDGDAFTETNTTDADGNYTVSDVPVGTYNVTASANPSGTITGVEVTEDETTENEDIEVVDADLTFEDQTYATSTDFVNVDTANLEGENESLFTVDLHPTDGDDNIIANEIIGTSEVLTGDNENVTVDLAEGEEITETDDFVAMIHLVDDDEVEVGDDAEPGQFPPLTVNGEPVVDQATVEIEDDFDNLAIVRGGVEDRQGTSLNGVEVQLVNNETGLTEDTFVTEEIDGDNGQFILEAAPEEATDYNLVVDDPDFRTFTRTIEGLEAGDRVDQSITLERIVTADELDVIEPDDPHTVDIEDDFDATVEVQTEDFDGEGLDPLPDEEVTANDVTAEFDNPNEAGASLEINPGTETTDDDGQATFNIGLDLDGDIEEYDEDITAQVEFTADDASDTLDITFEAEPPIGDGFVNGEVREITSGTADEEVSTDNVADAADTNVHAVRLDRFEDNAVSSGNFDRFDAAEDSSLNVNEGEETARVVVANTSGDEDEVVEVLNVQTDYLIFGDSQSVSQNLTVEETGFDILGSNGGYAVAVLESDEDLDDPANESYAVELGDELVTFDAEEDLTYDGIEDRYDGVTDGYTDVSDMNGEFGLQDLFTQDEVGQDHVVIAGDGNPGVGFANGQAYDIVDVAPPSDANDDQFSTALNVEAVEIQADSVNITNNGTHPPLAETGGAPDFDEVDEFDNQTAEFRQEVPRDGETIDVINLETFVEEDGSLVGDEVTVSYDADGDFDGQFANLSVGGEVLEVGEGNESITVDTSVVEDDVEDGEAFVFLLTDEAGLGDDVDVTIDVEMENAGDEAFTDKTFFGVLEQEYLSGDITGVVTDDDDNPVDARIFVNELVDEQAGVSIDFEADDVEELENFTATVSELETGDEVETVNLTADDMRNFEFQGFDSQLTLAENESEFELFADRADDRSTLSPVPAVEEEPGVSLSLTGVSQTGQTGESVLTAVEVDRTSTASIVIEGVDDSFFSVDNLDPEEATITQGDDLTVSADVENIGDLAGTQDIVLEVEDEEGDVTEVDSQELELDAGAGETVEFTAEDVQLDAGNYTHSISSADDSAEGSLTIEEADDNETDSDLLSEYVNEDGVVDAQGLNNAFSDWQAGDLTAQELNTVFGAWQSGDPVE